MRNVTAASIQFACTTDRGQNIEKAEHLIRKAAKKGANIILLQELFEGPYFCKDLNPDWFNWSHPRAEHPMLARMSDLARELHVVLPISFFERSGNVFFNSLVLIDADGTDLGIYRKSHIPDGPGYQEKYYFTPGDTGFRTWETRYGVVGAGICWDQWFPEAARAMALAGADILLYPTAIGSEPHDPALDSCGHWQRVMQGHAAANMIPVVAANRIGVEYGTSCSLTFYGSSFITDATGEILACASRTEEDIVYATFDLQHNQKLRRAWGLFRDRRPDLYRALESHDFLTKEE